jgi:hypothetical protein
VTQTKEPPTNPGRFNYNATLSKAIWQRDAEIRRRAATLAERAPR